MISQISSEEKNGFIRFVLTGVIRETDKVAVSFSEKDDDSRVWNRLPGNEEWRENTWFSPLWRRGLLDLDVKLKVTRSGKVIFETVTDELKSRCIPSGKGMRSLFEVLAGTPTQISHSSFQEGQQVLIIVPHGKVMRLHRAHYNTKDVTSIVQKFLIDRPNMLSIGGDFNREFEDSTIAAVKKTLSIEYSFVETSEDSNRITFLNSLESPRNILSDLLRLLMALDEIGVKSSFINVLECDSLVDGLLKFHSGIYGNLPNQATRSKASCQLRENIVRECDRHCAGILRWSTLFRCSRHLFGKRVKEFWQVGITADSTTSSLGTIYGHRFSSNADRGENFVEQLHSSGAVLAGCTKFSGAFIVRLVIEGGDHIAEANTPAQSYIPLLGEYCRSSFSVSGRPVYQHASGTYCMWHCTDSWCVGPRWSLGTSTCVMHSTSTKGNASSPPEDCVGWMVTESSGAWSLSPTIRCLPGRSLPGVIPHQDALLHMVRSQFIRALSDPGGVLVDELCSWISSLPQDVMKGSNNLDMNLPSILKTPHGSLKHAMFDTMSWREIAHHFATMLDSDKGVASEEFLVNLASAEGSFDRFVETLHAIQLSRANAPCSAAREAAHRLLLDRVDCPLLQDQAFVAQQLDPGNRAKFLSALSLHVPWAGDLGEEAATLLVCFLRHVLRAAQAGCVEHILRIADVLSKIVHYIGTPTNDLRDALGQAGGADAAVRVAITGQHHSLAVLEDGRLFAWGLDTEGRIGVGHNTRGRWGVLRRARIRKTRSAKFCVAKYGVRAHLAKSD